MYAVGPNSGIRATYGFKPFVLNFNMNEINKILPQLLGMLRTAESDLKKNGSKSILMVHEDKGKKKAKSKGNGKSKPKGKDAMKPEKGIRKKQNASTVKSSDIGKGTALST
ncbi:hypothetical protein V6N13_142050 [Hibiscus sabdariffa]